MKRHLRNVAALLAVLALAGCSRQLADTGTVGDRIVVADVGLATPESVLHDPEADLYLVSNIAGDPVAADGNGFIARLSPDGQIRELKWITGGTGVALNAPKGMAISGRLLYVTDINVVRTFDRSSGAPVGEIAVPGATFLNDVTPAPEGGVYVSDSGMSFRPDGITDTGTAAIYRLTADGALTAVARGASLRHPNGLLFLPERGLLMVPAGGDTPAFVGGDGSLTPLATLGGGGLDGVVRTGDGRVLVSSWEKSAIFAIDAAGAASTLLTDLPAPADIGYDAARNRLLVPLFNDNRVIIQKL